MTSENKEATHNLDRVYALSSYQASAVLNISCITILVDSNIITVEQAIERIEHIRDITPEGISPYVRNKYIDEAIAWLRKNNPDREKPKPQPRLRVVKDED